MKKLSTLGMIVGAALLCAAPVSMHWSSPMKEVRFLDTAQARLGRPLTPMSVGGSTAECIGARITVRRRQVRTITARITADIIPIHRAIEIVAFRSRLTDEIFFVGANWPSH